MTRCRSRTVTIVDSIGLVVRRWIQHSVPGSGSPPHQQELRSRILRFMDWVPVVAAAAVTFTVTQASTLLQWRHNDDVQNQRDLVDSSRMAKQHDVETQRLERQLSAELERLQIQLDSAAQKAADERTYAELIDWRDRRVTAFRSTSLAVAQLIVDCSSAATKGNRFAELFVKPVEWPTVDAHMTAIRSSLDECEMMCGAAVIDAGDALWSNANAFRDNAGRLVSARAELARAEKFHREEGIRNEIFSPPKVEDAQSWIQESDRSYEASKAAMIESREAWTKTCRAYLGVPD